jgi:hypothetical protein
MQRSFCGATSIMRLRGLALSLLVLASASASTLSDPKIE